MNITQSTCVDQDITNAVQRSFAVREHPEPVLSPAQLEKSREEIVESIAWGD